MRKGKWLHFGLVACIVVLSFSGCSKENDDMNSIDFSQSIVVDNENNIVQDDINQKENNTKDAGMENLDDQNVDSIKTTEDDTIEVPLVFPEKTKEILIYTMDDATNEVGSTVALIPETTEITADLIVNLVVDALADQQVNVGIEEVLVENDRVIVSFYENQPPLVNVGSGTETTILDAIAQSIVDNLTMTPKVVFRVEGKPYESGHYQFGLDEVYLDGSNTK